MWNLIYIILGPKRQSPQDPQDAVYGKSGSLVRSVLIKGLGSWLRVGKVARVARVALQCFLVPGSVRG